jgi:hypothetical protein
VEGTYQDVALLQSDEPQSRLRERAKMSDSPQSTAAPGQIPSFGHHTTKGRSLCIAVTLKTLCHRQQYQIPAIRHTYFIPQQPE